MGLGRRATPGPPHSRPDPRVYLLACCVFRSRARGPTCSPHALYLMALWLSLHRGRTVAPSGEPPSEDRCALNAGVGTRVRVCYTPTERRHSTLAPWPSSRSHIFGFSPRRSGLSAPAGEQQKKHFSYQKNTELLNFCDFNNDVGNLCGKRVFSCEGILVLEPVHGPLVHP